MSTNLITIKQLSEKLSVSVSTIYDWVSQGRVPYYKMAGGRLVRFNLQEIDSWLEEQRALPGKFWRHKVRRKNPKAKLKF